MDLTENDLLEQLQELLTAARPDGEGYTSLEWSVKWKLSREKSRNLIGAGLSAGMFVRGSRAYVRIDGQTSRVPVYALVDDNDKEEASQKVAG